MHGDEELLKTDVLGRVRTSDQRREALLDEFERSGVPATKFAELVGVNYQTFASWVRRRRRNTGANAKAPPLSGRGTAPAALRLVEAVVDSGTTSTPEAPVSVMVHLPGGVRVEMTYRAQAALVVELWRLLEARQQHSPC
jgi:transposase-like protein